jgi:polygalacturonase
MNVKYLAPLAAAALVAGWSGGPARASAPEAHTAVVTQSSSGDAAGGSKTVDRAALMKALGGAGANPATGPVLDVADYGAKGDGTTDDTAAIQAALDDASARHGTVVFPRGDFLTGALFVKSNTTLRIDDGVTLKAVQADTSWPKVSAAYPQIPTRVQGVEMQWAAAIINIDHAENVTVTGDGTIDGQGQSWWDHYYLVAKPQHDKDKVGWALNYDEERPRTIETFESKNVTLKDVTLKNSPFWTVHLAYTDGAHVDGVKVRNLMNASGRMPSTDGVDIDSSQNVLVERADIQANDDALVIKSGRDGNGLRANRPSENILIRNSLVTAGAAGFTIGSETSGGVRDVEVYNVDVKPLVAAYNSNIGYKAGGPTVYAGFIFKSAPTRGGTMENIDVHNVDIEDAYYFLRAEENWGSTNTIPAGYPADKVPPFWSAIMEMPSTPEAGIPHFRNFSFKNITMSKVESRVFDVSATAGSSYDNFTFKNIDVNATNSKGATVSGGSIRNAENWTFTNSSVHDADGNPVGVSLDPATTSGMTGLAGW